LAMSCRCASTFLCKRQLFPRQRRPLFMSSESRATRALYSGRWRSSVWMISRCSFESWSVAALPAQRGSSVSRLRTSVGPSRDWSRSRGCADQLRRRRSEWPPGPRPSRVPCARCDAVCGLPFDEASAGAGDCLPRFRHGSVRCLVDAPAECLIATPTLELLWLSRGRRRSKLSAR